MKTPFRWGIVGTGGIARHFAKGLARMPDMRLVAVASRSEGKAESFRREFGADAAFGSYADLLGAGAVDAVYLATVNSDHYATLCAAVAAGVPVLCEKPMLMRVAQLDEVTAAAREKGVALMEAMWSVFLPSYERIRQLLRADAIGEVRFAEISFCVDLGSDPASRILDPALGGGLIYDLGVYNLHAALSLFGEDYAEARFAGVRGATGVDVASAITLRYPSGLLVDTRTANVDGPYALGVYGTKGSILADRFNGAQRVVLSRGGETEAFDCPYEINGFEYEIREFAAVIRAGRIESAVLPLSRTRKVAELMERAVDEICGVSASD